jgi:hypothetical protein
VRNYPPRCRLRKLICRVSAMLREAEAFMAEKPEEPPIDTEAEKVLLWRLKRCLAAIEQGQHSEADFLWAEIREDWKGI